MSGDVRLARAYLTTVDTLDDDTLRQLAFRHGVISTTERVADAGARPVDWEQEACQLLDRARRQRVRFLTPADGEWPGHLDPSATGFGLWVSGRGRLGPLLRQPVVVLGSITPAPYAVEVAHSLARELTAAGRTVVTSGSPGVAGAVLRGALAADRPAVVVPSGGACHPRPLQHSRLFGRVGYRGLLVSHSAGHPDAHDTRFTRQTRLLAAAAAAVVLVDAGPGTLASAVAELVARSGRPVFAVPGPVLSRSEDEPAPWEFTHQLIRDDAARLVRGAGDVLDDLAAGGPR